MSESPNTSTSSSHSSQVQWSVNESLRSVQNEGVLKFPGGRVLKVVIQSTSGEVKDLKNCPEQEIRQATAELFSSVLSQIQSIDPSLTGDSLGDKIFSLLQGSVIDEEGIRRERSKDYKPLDLRLKGLSHLVAKVGSAVHMVPTVSPLEEKELSEPVKKFRFEALKKQYKFESVSHRGSPLECALIPNPSSISGDSKDGQYQRFRTPSTGVNSPIRLSRTVLDACDETCYSNRYQEAKKSDPPFNVLYLCNDHFQSTTGSDPRGQSSDPEDLVHLNRIVSEYQRVVPPNADPLNGTLIALNDKGSQLGVLKRTGDRNRTQNEIYGVIKNYLKRSLEKGIHQIFMPSPDSISRVVEEELSVNEVRASIHQAILDFDREILDDSPLISIYMNDLPPESRESDA